MVLRTLSLCSGIGGLELGIRSVVRARTVCYVEREAYSAAVLVARMAAAAMDPAPIWSELESFDAGPWRGKVDLVTAGFPCQPWSLAGQQKGISDPRWLWPSIFRIIRDVGSRLVFLENVPALVAGGLEHVLGDLAAGGFNAEWDCFTAEQIGAPHVRERIFLLAWDVSDADSGPLREQPEQPKRGSLTPEQRDSEPGELGSTLADADSEGRLQPATGRDASEGGLGDGCNLLGLGFPPGPSELQKWVGPKPAVRRSAHGLPSRLDRLRCLGNAVVPQQAALAWRILNERKDSAI